jgi:hypothetical protein
MAIKPNRIPKFVDLSLLDEEDIDAISSNGRIRNLARMQKARLVRRVGGINEVKRRMSKPRFPRSKVLDAIKGSKGILSVIADNLGCKRYTVEAILKRPGEKWDAVRRAFDAESEKAVDQAELTIHDLIAQEKDLAVAAQTAKWLLSRRRKLYADKAAENPVPQSPMTQINLNVVLDKMGTEEKREFLRRMDAEEQKLLDQ